MKSNSIKIRIKILVITLFPPIMLSLLIFYFFIMEKSAGYYVWLSVLAGTLIMPFFNKQRYLVNFSVAGEDLELIFISAFLYKSILKIHLKTIKDIEVTKPNYLISITGGLNIKTTSGWKYYHLIDRSVGRKLIQSITDADL